MQVILALKLLTHSNHTHQITRFKTPVLHSHHQIKSCVGADMYVKCSIDGGCSSHKKWYHKTLVWAVYGWDSSIFWNLWSLTGMRRYLIKWRLWPDLGASLHLRFQTHGPAPKRQTDRVINSNVLRNEMQTWVAKYTLFKWGGRAWTIARYAFLRPSTLWNEKNKWGIKPKEFKQEVD